MDKAAGLAEALAELGLSWCHVVGVGEAQNDLASLDHSAKSVAVAKVLPARKARADLVTVAERVAGVVELIDQLMADDLVSRLRRPDSPS